MIRTSIYAMDLRPESIFKVLWNYVQLSLSAQDILPLRPELTLEIQIAFGLVLAGLILFVAVMLRSRAWLALFFLAWYLITLSVYLPLANHISGYYATVPMVGLAMLGGWAIAVAWERNRLTRISRRDDCVVFRGSWSVAGTAALPQSLPAIAGRSAHGSRDRCGAQEASQPDSCYYRSR